MLRLAALALGLVLALLVAAPRGASADLAVGDMAPGLAQGVGWQDVRALGSARPARSGARVLGTTGFAQRWTFYIGKDGTILAIDKQVDPETSAEDIAAKLAELGVDERP
jgi:hypothetical protein